MNLKPYTIETTLLVIAFLLLTFVFFHYIWPAMNEDAMHPKAKKPTREEMNRRNEVDRLLDLDEHERYLS